MAQSSRLPRPIYTLIQTARLNFVDPEAWLCDVFTRIADAHPVDRMAELLPGEYGQRANS